MTTAIAAVLFFAIPTLAGLAICSMGKRAERYTLTERGETAGEALANAIAEHLIAGGNLGDIIGGEVQQHPSGAIRVRLVTRDDAEHVADEAETFLREWSA